MGINTVFFFCDYDERPMHNIYSKVNLRNSKKTPTEPLNSCSLLLPGKFITTDTFKTIKTNDVMDYI